MFFSPFFVNLPFVKEVFLAVAQIHDKGRNCGLAFRPKLGVFSPFGSGRPSRFPRLFREGVELEHKVFALGEVLEGLPGVLAGGVAFPLDVVLFGGFPGLAGGPLVDYLFHFIDFFRRFVHALRTGWGRQGLNGDKVIKSGVGGSLSGLIVVDIGRYFYLIICL